MATLLVLSSVPQQQLDNFRAGVAYLDELTDARAADGDERKFSRGEKSIHSNEEEDREKMEENHRALPARTSGGVGLTRCRTDERTNCAAIECNFSKLCGPKRRNPRGAHERNNV